jgi:N-carbamoylputrescine amidase
MEKIKIAWCQSSSQGSLVKNHLFYLNQCRELALHGAELIFLPELFLWDYICIEEKIHHFDQAIPLDHPCIEEYRSLAREFKICLFLPIFEKRAEGLYHNTILSIGVSGETLDLYRQMNLPHDNSFYEKYYFTPGDRGFRVVETPKLKVGTLICWDQWFPEAARLTAMQGAELLYYPTAIAWDRNEPDECYEDQLESWKTILRSHSIANNVFTLAVNRIGTEKHLQFWGNSLLSNPIGRVMEQLIMEPQKPIVEISPREIGEHRKAWPFFRDRRIDEYKGLTQRWLD